MKTKLVFGGFAALGLLLLILPKTIESIFPKPQVVEITKTIKVPEYIERVVVGKSDEFQFEKVSNDEYRVVNTNPDDSTNWKVEITKVQLLNGSFNALVFKREKK